MKATIEAEIIEVAKKFVGQEEVRGNKGFKEPWFAKLMNEMGFISGDAWCAILSKLIWISVYRYWDATMETRLVKLFNKSAVTTFRNFQKNKDFIVDNKPAPGCLVVWQLYKDGIAIWKGHMGVVVEVNIKWGMMRCIEGNTNEGEEREGYKVVEKPEDIDFTVKQNGLVLLGFIHPKQV